MSGGDDRPPQLFGGLGRALTGVTQPSVARQAGPPITPSPIAGCLSWPAHVPPMGTWVAMSFLPPLQGPGDTVTQRVFGKNKVEPPGDSSR